MNNNKTEKKKGLDVNENYDFNFAAKLNPVLRWILVLPMGIAGLLMVQLAGGWMVSFMLRGMSPESIVAIIVTALFGVVKYCIFVISMVATAPVPRQNKFRTGLVLSIIPFALPFAFARLALNLGGSIAPIMMAVNVGVILVGVAIALRSIHAETKKPLPVPELQEEAMPVTPVDPEQ